ncbi:MAG: hypothetical protein A2Z97_16190 [Bdellovibrionales bacterium GWB1_52_6]|nr:MAG: hypothetical protein A2Z97_16190 [Bdellovibrionales bacterium GWB1_52_6]OFZ05016.1 MAG: hypothetical protein A2X97_00270 [Bdellovibrionales bacterium GWA1_52_35]HCM41249.1 hypothetical protein [Bdellovibrionales bacterium]
MVCGSISLTRTVIGLLIAFSIQGCVKSAPETAQVLHLAHPEKVKGLDPIYSDDIYVADEASRVYETLFQYHYLKRPYTLIPNLAEAMPEISKDGRIYTIRLKKAVLFQDDKCFKATSRKGRELTADDVIYSLKRLVDPKLHSTGAWLLNGRVEGVSEWHQAAKDSEVTDYTKEIAGLKALDRYTIQIRLLKRSASFLYSLAMPFTGVVAPEAVAYYGKDFSNHAVGTGPFRLTEFSQNRQVWVRNPTFRTEKYPSEGEPGDREAGLLQDAGKTLPLIDKLVVDVYEEWQPLWLNFLSGKLDRTFIPKDSFSQTITAGKELSPELTAKGIRLHRFPLLDIVHLTLNMADPLLGKNKYLRQALSLAWDADRYNSIFWNGRSIPAQGPIPPGLAGFDMEYRNPYRQFNIKKAKELLAKAGFPEGNGLPPLIYNATADSSSRQATEYTVQMFKQIGVKVKVETYSWPEFQTLIRNRKGQIWSYAWNADYPDSENFLQLFYSKNASPGPNDSNYSNPAYDDLYERAITLPAGPARIALYQQMVRMIAEDCPWIVQVHRMGFHLTSPGFGNYKPSAFYHADAKYYRFDPAAQVGSAGKN